MRPVAFDVIQGELPGSAWLIKSQRELAPPAERARNFDRGGLWRLPVRNRPAEHFGEPGPLFA